MINIDKYRVAANIFHVKNVRKMLKINMFKIGVRTYWAHYLVNTLFKLFLTVFRIIIPSLNSIG